MPIPLPLAIPLSWLYLAGMRLDRARKRRRAQRLPIPVLSIGNPSVGGTGKSPMVLQIARWLADAGHHPCIAMRGYTPRTAIPAGPNSATSDEADAYRRAFVRLGLEVPIAAQPDRAEAVRRLLTHDPAIDRVILDDGFQHHQLARDLDIVLIDATRSPFSDRPLPAGWLREPPAALRRAHAIVITHAQRSTPSALADLARRIEEVADKPPIATTRHAWECLDTEPAQTLPVSWLHTKRILALAAIGNPAPFLAAARDAIGAEPARSITLRDHDPYAPATVERILAAALGLDAVLTTDKDWSKLRHIDQARWPCPVVRPRLGLAFDTGQEDLRRLILGVARPA